MLHVVGVSLLGAVWERCNDESDLALRPYFTAAYNMDPDCLRGYRALGVQEIFAGVSFPTSFGSGRVTAMRPPISYDELGEHFEAAHGVGIRTSFLFNPACSGAKEWTAAGAHEMTNVVRFVNRFEVDYIVVSNPFFVNLFRRLCPDTKIKISTHYNVNTRAKFDLFLRDLPVDVVAVSQFANKDFRLLQEVVEAYGGDRLEILCTVACMPACPYRTWHSTAIAHGQEMDIGFFQDDPSAYANTFQPCRLEMASRPELLMRSTFVRRQDLHWYQELGINRFKIGERLFTTESNLACSTYYLTQAPTMPPELAGMIFRGLVERAHLEAMDGYYDRFVRGECDGTVCTDANCGHCRSFAKRVFELRHGCADSVSPGFHAHFHSDHIDRLERLLRAFTYPDEAQPAPRGSNG